MKKGLLPVFAGVLSLSLILSGCAPTDVDTGTGSDQVKADEVVTQKEKRFKANASTEVLGVKINIAEVVIKPDRIEVGMNLENTNPDLINWYPDQEGKAIVEDKQLDANMFMGDSIGGEVASGVKQNGVLVFLTNGKDTLDPKAVKEIKLDLGEISSADFTKTERATIKFQVK
jgi:hypothetical protein